VFQFYIPIITMDFRNSSQIVVQTSLNQKSLVYKIHTKDISITLRFTLYHGNKLFEMNKELQELNTDTKNHAQLMS